MNRLLTQAEAVSLFDVQLQKLCGISVADAGLDREDVLTYVSEAHSEMQVEHAVLDFAAHRDLDVRGRDWVS